MNNIFDALKWNLNIYFDDFLVFASLAQARTTTTFQLRIWLTAAAHAVSVAMEATHKLLGVNYSFFKKLKLFIFKLIFFVFFSRVLPKNWFGHWW